MSVTCRLRQPVEQRLERGVMWDGTCGASTLHSTRWDVGPATEDHQAGGIDYEDKPASACCERCGTEVPWDDEANLKRFGGGRTVWDTEDGRLHPGDMHWGSVRPDGEHHCSGRWSNCDGRHLYVVLPNGHGWDIDSRANNCSLPDDRMHRCWVRTGEPPAVTAGKDGPTCAAGAGSILSGDYHGFLQAGVLT